jgi:hypothetical protein
VVLTEKPETIPRLTLWQDEGGASLLGRWAERNVSHLLSTFRAQNLSRTGKPSDGRDVHLIV